MKYCKFFNLLRDVEGYPHREVNEGLLKIGLERSYIYSFSKDLLLVTWTPWKKSLAYKFGTAHKEQGGKWLVMENGYLPKIKGSEYYLLEENGFNGRGKIKTEQEDRFEISTPAWNKEGSYVLVIAQFGHRDTDISMPISWPDNVVMKLREFTSRQIVYRPKVLRPRFLKRRYLDVMTDNESNLEDQIKHAWAVVVYSSKAAVNALQLGVPVFVCGPNSVAADFARRDISNIESPYYPENRKELFNKISWAQWNKEELVSGYPFKRFLCE